jgi:hypothetical protein
MGSSEPSRFFLAALMVFGAFFALPFFYKETRIK